MKRWLALASLLALGAGAAADIPGRLRAQEAFDDDVFNGQKWEKLGETHAENVVVFWPDGRQTTGLHAYIQDMKTMFVATPGLRIDAHPVRFGSGDWTAAIGEMSGAFTADMPLGGGRVAHPNGRAFRLRLAVVAHWSGGKMDRKYLFYDQHAYLRQLGLAN